MPNRILRLEYFSTEAPEIVFSYPDKGGKGRHVTPVDQEGSQREQMILLTAIKSFQKAADERDCDDVAEAIEVKSNNTYILLSTCLHTYIWHDASQFDFLRRHARSGRCVMPYKAFSIVGRIPCKGCLIHLLLYSIYIYCYLRFYKSP